jgi:ArsR family transcriptional regulator, arsenate/arsenite/antimonite-responsive transcriptional repressor
VSKQGSKRAAGQERVLEGLPDVVGCCAPLVRDPVSVDRAIELSRLFKALGDPVRLRLVSLIASQQGGEACVCELTDGFDLTGPTISHHLKVLREAGLISGERRGTWVYYRVDPDALHRLSEVLSIASVPA